MEKKIILKGVAEFHAGVNPLDLIINHGYSRSSPLLRISFCNHTWSENKAVSNFHFVFLQAVFIYIDILDYSLWTRCAKWDTVLQKTPPSSGSEQHTTVYKYRKHTQEWTCLPLVTAQSRWRGQKSPKESPEPDCLVLGLPWDLTDGLPARCLHGRSENEPGPERKIGKLPSCTWRPHWTAESAAVFLNPTGGSP